MPDLDELNAEITRNLGLERLERHLGHHRHNQMLEEVFDENEDPEWLNPYDFTADL